jgi:hypothetical protein
MGLGEMRPGGRGCCRWHREPRRQADAGRTRGQRGLRRHDLLGRQQLRLQLGCAAAQRGHLGLGGPGIGIEQEQPRRFTTDAQVARAGLGQRSVPGQALGVERNESRVERVLDRAEIAPGCPGADGGALDDDDRRTPVGHDRGRRAADDAAADDDDVGARP